MENLYGELKDTGETLETSGTLRIPKRPHGDSKPNPKAFEDFGSSLAPRSSQPTTKSKFKPATVISPESTRSITIKKPMSRLATTKKPLADFYESEDELDFLSSSQPDPDDYQPSKKATVSNSRKYVDQTGQEHEYDPNFLPSKSKVLAKIKFTKNKKPAGKDNTTLPSLSSSSKNQPGFKENSQDFASWVDDFQNHASIPSSSSFSKNKPGLKENSQDFSSWVDDLKNRAADKQATTEDTSTGGTKFRRSSVDDDDLEIYSPLRVKGPNRPPPKQPIQPEPPNAFIPPRPRPRPLPRPVPKRTADAKGSKPSLGTGSGLPTTSQFKIKSSAVIADGLELIPLDRGKTKATATNKKSSSRSPSPDISISTPTKKDRSGSLSSKNFPMDMISPLGGKVKQKLLPKPTASLPSFDASGKLNAFPMPSPPSNDKARIRVTSQSKGKNKAKPFPLDDLDEDAGDDERDYGGDEGKGKGKNKAQPFSLDGLDKDTGDDESDHGGDKGKGKVKAKGRPKSRPKPKAFPMPAQILASIESPSVPKRRLPKYQKRISEDHNDDERQAKKKRRSSLSRYVSEDECDSISISPDTNPRTLCPYCDTPLPSSPSSLLINILASTRKKSTRDPRPSNPLGLKAPLAIFIIACQRHKFESQILPEAEGKGWPKTILWQNLGARVEGMKDELQALIEDPGGEREIDDVDEAIDEVERLFRDDGDGTKGPRTGSIFWAEVMDEIKKKGSRAVAGVRGQFANFEKTQPGYYGEQGSVIIHQTLFDMFPPAAFDPSRISPLTSNEFVLRILVPEVALRLIMEDRDLDGTDGMHQALIVLRESAAYGVAMFPEDGVEGGTGKKRWDVMGVGDKIVMERARKRRKELEEEEEQEEREEERRRAEMETELEMEELKEEKMGGRKRKGKQKKDQQPEEQEAPLAPVEKPRPRPRPIMKASSSMSVLSQPPQSSARPRSKDTNRTQSRTRSMYSGMDTDLSDDLSSRAVVDVSTSKSDDYHRPTSKDRKRSPRRFSRNKSNAIHRSDSTMDMDMDDEDEDDVSLEIEIYRRLFANTVVPPTIASSDNEQTPKPLMLPRTRGSGDIKPLMVARMRQKNNWE